MSPAAKPGAVPPDLVEMANVKEPYGLKGWIKLYSYSTDGAGLAGFDEWWLDRGTEAKPDWQLVKPEQVDEHSGTLIAKLPGVEDRDAAFALKSKRIAVSRALFPASREEEGYYWSDLIGLLVKNREDEVLGEVADLMDLGPHEVLRVMTAAGEDGKRGEILIPFVAQYVDQVDVAGKVIKVDWGRDY
ncbi:MAG: rimM [Betaproteobacteria bacterium]|nr:rimM [Betaproteobacteria bacterium]